MKILLIIFYVVLANLSVGQTLKFIKEKAKFSISKGDEVTINLKDGSVLEGTIVKLSDHEITVKTTDKEKKSAKISEMQNIEKCRYTVITARKKYGRRCKSENISDFKHNLIK